MALLLLATASCKQDRTNVVPAYSTPVSSKTLKGTTLGDVLTYRITGERHTIQYKLKEYSVNVSTTSNANIRNVLVNGVNGRVTLYQGNVQSISFPTNYGTNLTFESNYYD